MFQFFCDFPSISVENGASPSRHGVVLVLKMVLHDLEDLGVPPDLGNLYLGIWIHICIYDIYI